MYKILNDRNAPNLKDAFCTNNERDNRNKETDLPPPMPGKEFIIYSVSSRMVNIRAVTHSSTIRRIVI